MKSYEQAFAMKRDQNRKCAMCDCGGLQSKMTKILKNRYNILKPWYPTQLKSPSHWVHRTCIAALGLHPYPKDMIPLDEIIGSKLTARIADIVAHHPDVRGPRQLIDVVFKKMRNEFRVPTNEGHKQLRYMISQWITTRLMGNGRGGVSSIEDGAYMDLSSNEIIENVDIGCRLSDWMLAEDVPPVESVRTTNEFIDKFSQIDFATTPVERLKSISEFASAVGDTFVKMSNAREKETIARTAELEVIGHNLEREKDLVCEKRAAAPVLNSIPSCKRARVEPTLNQQL